MKVARFDKPLLISIILLAVGGFFIFSSASLGLLARDGARYANVAFTQTFYGLFLGAIFFLIASRVDYKFLKKLSLPFFFFSLALTLAVFIPALGYEHGGAHRWISLGPFSFQPAEFLKIAYVLYLATWLSNAKQKVGSFLYGFMPFLLITALAGGALLMQPDTDTFMVMAMAGFAMYAVAGAKKRYLLLFIILGLSLATILAVNRPYVMQRLTTFLNPLSDSLGASYQVQQSLIAVGSGGIMGRGFGQSIQKYNFLPEPIGDSIFAVAGEEFGLIGSSALILLFLFFAWRGLKIASRAADAFGGLIAVGIVILICAQAAINIASMLGVFPLSGIPLPFVSHGGTALLVTLTEAGLLLGISRFRHTE